MEWLGQIGGVAGIAALVGVVLGSNRNSCTKEFKTIFNGLQIQLNNSHREKGRLFDRIDKLESKVEKLRESLYEFK